MKRSELAEETGKSALCGLSMKNRECPGRLPETCSLYLPLPFTSRFKVSGQQGRPDTGRFQEVENCTVAKKALSFSLIFYL